MCKYLVPARNARIDVTVVNSRFIATVAPVFTTNEAKDFIQRIRKEFPDASANVPAYVIGHGASVVAHCSDDGEPTGTAGRPALAVLRSSGLGDVAVVVTRYFGGTELGTGGLVRAYSNAVREVLAVVPRARRVPTCTVMTVLPYPLYERARLLITAHEGTVIDQDFSADVTLRRTLLTTRSV